MACLNCGSTDVWTKKDEGDCITECRYCGEIIENGIVTKKGKILHHVDELTEKALDWWANQFDDVRTTTIVEKYMREHKIEEKDVAW